MQPTDYALGMPLVALGFALFIGGVLGLAWIFRYELGYDEPEIPPVVEPDPDRTAIVSAVMPEPNYHRSDDDTHVIPRIPGATPELPPQLAAVARYLDTVDAPAEELALAPIPGLREERIDEEVPAEVLQRVRDGLADLGPVCPFCGGPWHAVCPSAPKSAPEQTQVVDLCPLTTQDIVVPSEGEAPFHDAMARESNQSTRDLSGSLARAKECAA